MGILHVHFGYNGIKAIKLKQRSGTAMLCSFYGDDAYRYPSLPGYAEKYERLFIEAERILVLGPYMKSSLVKLGCPEDKIIIHHLGVNLDSVPFRQRPLKKRGIRFLVAAGFVEKKGIDVVITSLSSLSEKYDFTLDIIGDGPLRNEVYSWVESSGIKERITMHGFKPNKFLIEKALDCDVFIQASRTTRDNHKEGTPMAIVDAMATGLAVVSTHHSDIPEIVLDGVTGFLAEENDVDSLTACIKKILDNPEFIGPMGEAGRKRVEAEFNALTQTEKLEAIYSELLGKG